MAREIKPKFEVRKDGNKYKVWDTGDKIWITIAIEDKKIADEICTDFNNMHNNNFQSIGLPDFSKDKPRNP